MARVIHYPLAVAVALVATALTLFACRGGVSVTPADPTACPALLLDILKTPTAALAFEWNPPNDSDNGGHHWGAVDRSGSERFLNVEFVPQGGWAVPANTKGLAFDMFAHMPDDFGIDPIEGISVAYVLEYTLPSPRCNMNATWDARLSVRLPHGVCVAREGTPGQCSNNGGLYGDFQIFSVDDPTGTMGVTGSGRAALEDAILAALATSDDRSRVHVSWNTQSDLQKGRYFKSSFDVDQGVSAHVYVGVSAMILKTSHGWACLQKCTTAPTDRLVDHGLFLVESGSEGGEIGVGMTRR